MADCLAIYKAINLMSLSQANATSLTGVVTHTQNTHSNSTHVGAIIRSKERKAVAKKNVINLQKMISRLIPEEGVKFDLSQPFHGTIKCQHHTAKHTLICTRTQPSPLGQDCLVQ